MPFSKSLEKCKCKCIECLKLGFQTIALALWRYKAYFSASFLHIFFVNLLKHLETFFSAFTIQKRFIASKGLCFCISILDVSSSDILMEHTKQPSSISTDEQKPLLFSAVSSYNILGDSCREARLE
jgi:hypothetical protein